MHRPASSLCLALLFLVLVATAWAQTPPPPEVRITIHRAPGTGWESRTPFTIVLTTNLQFASTYTGGRGTPLFAGSVQPGTEFLGVTNVTGFVLPSNGPSSVRSGTTNFVGVTIDPETGARRTWVSASLGAYGIISGFEANWEHQVRYDSGLPGVAPARLELGTVANAGIWTGTELSPSDYTVQITWNAAEALLDPNLSGFAAREILAGRDPAERLVSYYADPIDAGSGGQVMQFELLRQEGLFPFGLEIQHSTLFPVTGPLGRGWSHGYEARLDLANPAEPVVRWGGGRRSRFEADEGAPGTWRGADLGNRHDRLRALPGGGFVHEPRDGLLRRFAADGTLVRVEAKTGPGVDLSHAGGRLDRVTEPVSGRFLAFQHDGEGRLIRVEDGAGRSVTFHHAGDRLSAFDRSVGAGRRPVRAACTYDLRGRLLVCRVGEVDAQGAITEDFILFENGYDIAGRIVRQWGYGGQARGVEARFQYVEAENPSRVVTLASGPSYYLALNAQEILAIEAGTRALPSGCELFVHDEHLRLVRKLEDRGREVNPALVRDTRWTFADGIDPVRRESNVQPTTDWTYDARGRTLSETTATGKERRWEWDAAGNLVSQVDPEGRTTRLTYDAANRPVIITDPAGGASTFTYDADGALLTSTSAAGVVRRFTHVGGVATRIEEPGGHEFVHAYDAAGRRVETTGPGGRRWAWTHDDLGGVTRTELPGGTTILATWDHREPDRSLVTSETDPLGHVTTYEHRVTFGVSGSRRNHQLVRPLSAWSDPIGRTLLLHGDEISPYYWGFAGSPRASVAIHDAPPGYDHAASALSGKLLSGVQRLHVDGPVRWRFGHVAGSGINYEYGTQGAGIFEARQTEERVAFDIQGRVTKRTTKDDLHRPLRGMGFVAHDVDGHPVRLETRAGTVMRRHAHDASGLLISIEDPARGTTLHERDPAGRLVEVTLPDGTTASRGVDADGFVVEQVAPSGAVTRFTRGADGRVATITWPDESATRLEWDAYGALVRVERPSGVVVTNTYDTRGFLAEERDAAGATVHEHDAAGRLVSTSRGALTTLREYDARGRLVRYVDSHGKEFRFGYDARDRLVSLGYPDGSTLAYDGIFGPATGGDVASIRNPAWGLALEVDRPFPPNADVETAATGWRLSGGNPPTFEWRFESTRQANRSTRLVLISEIALASRVSTLFEVTTEGPAWDPFPSGWLVDSQSIAPAVNPLAWRPPAPRVIARGLDGRATALDGSPLTYDADGQLVAGPLPDGTAAAYAWDARGRLVVAGGVNYLHDPEDQPRGWEDATGITRFFVAPLQGRSTILGMETPDGETVWFVHGPEGLMAERGTRRGLRFYGFDPAGNTIWHGHALESASAFHEPFGERVAESGEWITPFRYRGREGVPTAPNGLVWMGARHYHPAIRSFVSPDPDLGRIEVPGSLDRYAYALNNPLAYTDPTGLAPDGLIEHERRMGPFRPRRIAATVALMKGSPLVTANPLDRAAPSVPLQVGDVLFEGETVVSPKGSRIKLRLSPGAGGSGDVVVGSDTQLQLTPPSSPPSEPSKPPKRRLNWLEREALFDRDSDFFAPPIRNAPAVGVRG